MLTDEQIEKRSRKQQTDNNKKKAAEIAALLSIAVRDTNLMQSNIINRCGAFLDECDIFFNGIEGDFILPNSLNLDDLVAQSTII